MAACSEALLFHTLLTHCHVGDYIISFLSDIGKFWAPGGGGGGGGHSGTEGGRACDTFLYLGTKYGGQNPLTIDEICAALTPSVSQSDWASEFAAATCCR